MNLKEKKTMKIKAKQTTRIGTEPQKWRSHGTVINRGVGGGERGERYRE